MTDKTWEEQKKQKIEYCTMNMILSHGIDEGLKPYILLHVQRLSDELLSLQQKQIFDEVDRKIVEHMNRYANTQLKDRKNAFNELSDVRKTLTGMRKI